MHKIPPYATRTKMQWESPELVIILRLSNLTMLLHITILKSNKTIKNSLIGNACFHLMSTHLWLEIEIL